MRTGATSAQSKSQGLLVNAIEKGKYDPSLPLAFRISRVFGSSIEEFFDPSPDDQPK